MSALKKILAGGVVAAAMISAAPAVAQYYPGYGSPYGYGGGDVVGQVIGQVIGGGYNNGYGGYGMNSQAVIGQCVGAVQARLNGGYAGGYGGYGYNQYGYNGGGSGARVLGISRVEPRSGGGVIVRGAANSGRYAYGYGSQVPVDLTFRCSADYRGYITNVDIRPAQSNYGGNYTPYNGYSQYGNGYSQYGNGYPQGGNDYSQYGYSRY